MTRLVEALRALGLEGDIAQSGRWLTLRGQLCLVYVAEADWGQGFYTWCDAPDQRSVERYDDPVAAIRAGLQRAALRPPAHGHHTPGAGTGWGATA